MKQHIAQREKEPTAHTYTHVTAVLVADFQLFRIVCNTFNRFMDSLLLLRLK